MKTQLKSGCASAFVLGLALAITACAPAPTETTDPRAGTVTETRVTAESPTPTETGHEGQTGHGLPYDAEFLDMMVMHHEGALVMARDTLEQSKSAQVRELAETILKDQEQEISDMKKMRQEWYPDVAAMSHDDMGHHMGPMEVPAGEEPFDQRFLEAMILHHQSALDMSREAQQRAEHPELKDLAGRIVMQQEKEIAHMQELQKATSP